MTVPGLQENKYIEAIMDSFWSTTVVDTIDRACREQTRVKWVLDKSSYSKISSKIKIMDRESDYNFWDYNFFIII